MPMGASVSIKKTTSDELYDCQVFPKFSYLQDNAEKRDLLTYKSYSYEFTIISTAKVYHQKLWL